MAYKTLAIAALAGILATGTAHAQFFPAPQPMPFRPVPDFTPQYLPPVQSAPMPQPFFTQPVPPPPGPQMMLVTPYRSGTTGYFR